MTSPYGYRLEAELHRALRGRPPRGVLEWVRQVIGAARVTRIRALPGGMSSAVHLLTLETSSGVRERVVLRRYVLDWLADEPYTPGNEAAVLGSLAMTPVPAPTLLAADPDGALTGTPAVVMSALPGRVDWDPKDFESWQRRLAESLCEVHSVPLWQGLRPFEPYPPAADLCPPPWTRHQWAWERAIELYERPAPPAKTVFMHRDYHPGNVLWSRQHITGIVDWVSSCAGPPEADVAHCRSNLARHLGQGAADRFLATWQSVAGQRDYHPYWDLTDIVSTVPNEPDEALDEFAASAAARL